MKIGIDARPLTVERFTGIPNYVYQICKQWMETHPEHEYYLMSRRPICFKQEDLPDNWHIVDDPWIIDKGKFWFLFKLPQLIKKHQLDVFWGPNFSLPAKVDSVEYYITVHDMAIFKFKHVGQLRNSIQIKLFLKKNLKKASKIIAVSKSTKNDVVDLMGIKSQDVAVVYNAGDCDIKKSDDQIRPELGSLEDFFLFVGTIEPRKNIVTIIDGFEKYCDSTDSSTKLVIAGGKGWNCDDIYIKASNSRYADRILLPGFISDVEKDYLYQNARAFVYPSLYEGFGMPILEAFKYGTPVITAYNSSLPEVGGDAAFYVDTFDSDKLCEYMQQISTMSQADINILKEKIEKQLSLFSWQTCAEETLDILTGGC